MKYVKLILGTFLGMWAFAFWLSAANQFANRQPDCGQYVYCGPVSTGHIIGTIFVGLMFGVLAWLFIRYRNRRWLSPDPEPDTPADDTPATSA
jgi:hypothetical protein